MAEKLTEKQREILESRKKALKSMIRTNKLFILIGILICITVVGAPVGFLLILWSGYKYWKNEKELTEIEFKLAGN